MVRTAWALAFALTLGAPSLHCQTDESPSPRRDLGFGTIRTLDGEPWVGARVHLMHQAHPAVPDELTTDRIEVRTDEQGRYRTQMLVGCEYTVWAVGELQPDGTTRRTNFSRGVLARQAVVLEEQEPRRVRYVRFHPHPSWDGHEELSVRSYKLTMGPQPARWWRESPDAVFETKPPATTGFAILVNGTRVFGASVPGRDKTSGLTREDPLVIEIPARQVDRRLLLAADGSPIAGATTMLEQAREISYGSFQSDDQGWLEVLFASPYPNLPTFPRHIVVAEQFAEIDFDRIQGEQFHVPRGFAATGSVKIDGQTVASVPIVVDSSMGAHGGTWYGPGSRVFRCGEDGTFRILGRQRAYPFRLTAILEPGLRARLSRQFGTDDRRPLSPCAILAIEGSSGEVKDNTDLDFGSIDLFGLRPLDIDVATESGVPPGSVLVHALPLAEGRLIGPNGFPFDQLHNPYWPHESVRLRTDRLGRVRMLYRDPKGSTRWLLYVETPDGSGWTISDPQNREPTRVVINPATRVAFRVVDSEGEVVDDAFVWLNHLEALLQREEDPVLLAAFRVLSSSSAVRNSRATVNEDGIAVLTTPLLDVRLNLSVGIRGAQRRQVAVDVTRNRPNKPIELTLSK